MKTARTSTRLLAEIAVAVALAYVLGMLRLYRMPQGGSITLEMVPVLLVAFRHGGRAGVLAGIVYGFVQLAQGPSIVHPVQFLVDYPVAYGLLGLAGWLAKPAWLGVVAGAAGRYAAHVASGVLFFAEYAPEGTPALLYSLGYNASYMIPETILAAAVTGFLVARTELGRPSRLGSRA
ncbi:MAG: energy-coupled thiamine transporter ThiT [Firmicutes bacterium]|nr:energy-coupled thiamine transporter ThiT [Bacillota bacterium]